MGVGFGLVMLIGVAGDNISAGIGVGGFFVIMGLAFFINSLFDHSGSDIPFPAARPASGSGSNPPENIRRE
jgi:hypothetical protein